MEVAALLYTIALLILTVVSVYDNIQIRSQSDRIDALEKQVKTLAKRKVAPDGPTSVKKRT